MWEFYRANAELIIEGSGIIALLAVVRGVADDPATPEKVRRELKDAVEAFSGEGHEV